TFVSAYTVETEVSARGGDRFQVGGYDILFRGVKPVESANFTAEEGEFELRNGGRLVTGLASQQRTYRAPQTPTADAAVEPGPRGRSTGGSGATCSSPSASRSATAHGACVSR